MNFELLVSAIEQTHQHFQQQASKAINVSLTLRNWLTGYYIVEFEQKGEDRAKYGDKLLARLAEKCATIKGLDERTFRNFRLFYLLYPQIRPLLANQMHSNPIRRSLTAELKNDTIYDTLSIWGSLTSEFQLTEFQLKGELLVQSLSYTHFEQLIRINDSLKRAYYEMECIKGNWSVRELKRQINSHVLVELKVENFNHYNIGQLNTYVNYYKAEVMRPDDNPTVGILMVTNKNNALVEFATAGMDNHLFVSKYLLELPKKEQLEAFITNEITKWNR